MLNARLVSQTDDRECPWLRAEMFMPLLQPDDDGFVTVPYRPGIGYELNMDLLNRYRVG